MAGLGIPSPSRFPYFRRPQPSPGVGPSPGIVVRANRVIVFGRGGGLYVYSGPPATGNLVESAGVAPGVTQDPFRLNAVLPGDTNYNYVLGHTAVLALQKTGGQITAYMASTQAGPYTQISTIQFGTGGSINIPGSLQIATGTIFVPPSGDTSGGTDGDTINSWLASGYAVILASGARYYSKVTISLAAPGNWLRGQGAIVIPTAALVNGLFNLSGGINKLSDVQLYGGTNSRGSNPAGDGIVVAAGTQNIWVTDIYSSYINGDVIDPVSITAGLKMTVRGVKGTNNAGGVRLVTATGISTQVDMDGVNLQQCEVSEALYLQNVFDVAVNKFNSSVFGSAGMPTVHLLGKVTTCQLASMNCGVFGAATAGVPVLHVEDSGGASVTDCRFSDSTYQAGGHGIVVDGGTARCQWSGVAARNNLGDGWQFNGTGDALAVSNGVGNGNGGAADVNVTGPAHVGLSFFDYSSGGVGNSLIVPGVNHVTNANPTSPGGKAVSGVPSGW